MLSKARLAEMQIVEALKSAHEPMGQSVLARAAGQSPTTVSNRLKRLAAKGAVVRTDAGWTIATAAA
jgi:DNA-binding IclR family transcriptional regulator